MELGKSSATQPAAFELVENRLAALRTDAHALAVVDLGGLGIG